MLRSEKACITKNKIFEAAVTLIKAKGYDNVTISEICNSAGVAKGTFYVHYKSKEDIVKESYYSDMREYVLKQYKLLIDGEEKLKVKEKIKRFLLAELMFSKYVGRAMTCRAYITNLSECIDGESEHNDRRRFSYKLKELIVEAIEKNEILEDASAENIFLYLESFIRGIMASWCFMNSSFDIVKQGEQYIDKVLLTL